MPRRTAGLVRVSKRRRARERELDRITPALTRRARDRCELSGHALTLPACSGPMHRHHRLRRSQGGTHELSNLLYVCDAHHRWIHDHPRASEGQGWLVRSK